MTEPATVLNASTAWMPEPLLAALATPGIGWLCLIIFVAGCVRGFAGFGTALIFVPLAALFIPPVWVVIVVMVADIAGPLLLVPRALRDASRPDLGALLAGCALALPAGLLILSRIDPENFRWLAAGLALAMVALLASGWRHTHRFGRRSLAGIGAMSGLLGGVTGQPGPPVILAYLGGNYPAARIRANTLLFLLGFDILLAAGLILSGLMAGEALMLGFLLALPNMLGNLIGARIFDPARERLYRYVAYGLIAMAALAALPVTG